VAPLVLVQREDDPPGPDLLPLLLPGRELVKLREVFAFSLTGRSILFNHHW